MSNQTHQQGYSRATNNGLKYPSERVTTFAKNWMSKLEGKGKRDGCRRELVYESKINMVNILFIPGHAFRQ